VYMKEERPRMLFQTSLHRVSRNCLLPIARIDSFQNPLVEPQQERYSGLVFSKQIAHHASLRRDTHQNSRPIPMQRPTFYDPFLSRKLVIAFLYLSAQFR